MISFIYVVGEVSVSIIIGILNPAYAPMTVYMRDVWLSAAGSERIAAALGSTLMLMQLVVILIVVFVFKKSYGFVVGV
jgi:ABC-type Fe3+ transport system permease subunit